MIFIATKETAVAKELSKYCIVRLRDYLCQTNKDSISDCALNSFSVLSLLTDSFCVLFHFHYCVSIAIDYVYPIIFYEMIRTNFLRTQA